MNLENIDKIFTVGDLHFGIYNNALAWRDSQIAYMLSIPEIAKSHGFNPHTDILVLLGDIFTIRESINVMISNYVEDMFKELAKFFVRGVYILIGNHDTYYKDRNDINSLRMISNIAENIHVFQKPEPMYINDRIECLMLPWVTDPAKTASIISESPNAKYLFAHLEINGMTYDNGMKIENGVNMETLKQFTRVYSGHIHKRDDNGFILYVGSPYQMERSDIGNQKGLYILSVNDDVFDEVFVPNNMSPVFSKYDMYDILNMQACDIAGILNNNYIDILTDRMLAAKMNFVSFSDMLKENNILPKRIDFPTYNNNENGTVDIQYTGELNLFTIGIEILKFKKKTEKESKEIMDYFGTLMKKVTEKENEPV